MTTLRVLLVVYWIWSIRGNLFLIILCVASDLYAAALRTILFPKAHDYLEMHEKISPKDEPIRPF